MLHAAKKIENHNWNSTDHHCDSQGQKHLAKQRDKQKKISEMWFYCYAFEIIVLYFNMHFTVWNFIWDLYLFVMYTTKWRTYSWRRALFTLYIRGFHKGCTVRKKVIIVCFSTWEIVQTISHYKCSECAWPDEPGCQSRDVLRFGCSGRKIGKIPVEKHKFM